MLRMSPRLTLLIARRRSGGRLRDRPDEQGVPPLQRADSDLDGRRHEGHRGVAARPADREGIRRARAREEALRGHQPAQLPLQRSARRGSGCGRQPHRVRRGSRRLRGDVPLVRRSERAGLHRLRDGDGHGAHAAQAPDQRQRGRAARHRGGRRDCSRSSTSRARRTPARRRSAARMATSSIGTSRSRTRPTSRPRCAA